MEGSKLAHLNTLKLRKKGGTSFNICSPDRVTDTQNYNSTAVSRIEPDSGALKFTETAVSRNNYSKGLGFTLPTIDFNTIILDELKQKSMDRRF